MAKEYKACMASGLRRMRGSMSKSERKVMFCSMAKVCSGKAKSLEAAKRMCHSR